jgi:uncharacterized OB-fold protein
MTYRKPLPEGIPTWHMPFWDSLRAHDVKVQRCDHCGAFRYVPKEICSRCLRSESTWLSISGRGTVYSYSIVHRTPTPAFQADAPYVIAHVEMEEGFRMVSNVAVDDPSAVTIGMPVELDYNDVTPEWTLFLFRPAPN